MWVICEGSERERKRKRRDFSLLKTYLAQVVETPGQDDDVVDIQQGHDHNGGVTNTWREERGEVKVMIQKQSNEVARAAKSQNVIKLCWQLRHTNVQNPL